MVWCPVFFFFFLFFLTQVIFWKKLFQNHKSSREKVFSVVLHCQYLFILLICNYTVRLSAISLSWCFLIDQQLKNLTSSWLPTGTFPWQVHWHRLLSAFLQTHAEQEANTQRPWVHWPRVLQLTHMDQVIDLSCVRGLPYCVHLRRGHG